MHINQAKDIPLSVFVEHLGGRYSHQSRQGELWYHSPFRPDERTASFKINEKTRKWHDFGLVNGAGKGSQNVQGNGGDILDLWCDFHNQDRKQGIKQALQELAKFTYVPARQAARSDVSVKNFQAEAKVKGETTPRYKLLKVHPHIFYPSLKEELDKRRISLKLANLFLKQGFIADTETGKTYNGFLFPNDKAGYELSTPNPAKGKCFKSSLAPKAITTIPGTDQSKADVFEGFWDFLSHLEMHSITAPKHQTFVLNSLSFCVEAVQKIIALKESVQAVFLFMDNDKAGYQAIHAIAKELEPQGLIVGSMEQLYQGHKDLNEYWQQKNVALEIASPPNKPQKYYYDSAWDQVANRHKQSKL